MTEHSPLPLKDLLARCGEDTRAVAQELPESVIGKMYEAVAELNLSPRLQALSFECEVRRRRPEWQEYAPGARLSGVSFRAVE